MVTITLNYTNHSEVIKKHILGFLFQLLREEIMHVSDAAWITLQVSAWFFSLLPGFSLKKSVQKLDSQL